MTENSADYCASNCALPSDFGVPDSFVQSDCPAGSLCFRPSQYDDGAGLGRCVQECREDADCRTTDGYYCRRTFQNRTYDNGYCAPAHCHSRGCVGYRCSC
jgi:hypothetical protein